jgi:hypothetical protein
MSPHSRPTLTGNKVVTINKMKSAEFARADAGGIFEVHNSFVGLEHLTEEELKEIRGRCLARAKGEIAAVAEGTSGRQEACCHRLRRNHWLAIVARELCRGRPWDELPGALRFHSSLTCSSNCSEYCSTDPARPWI